MKKERFKEIVTSNSSTKEEIGTLKKLAHDYPFSQIIHILLANSVKGAEKKEFTPTLKNAAFYATDRSIVKSLIENNLVPSERVNPSIKSTIDTKKATSVYSSGVIPNKAASSDHLAEDVLKNLEELQKVKKEAALWLDGLTSPKKEKKKTSSKIVVKKQKDTKKNTPLKSQSKLIEKFIKEEPSITKNSAANNTKEDMAKESSRMRDDVISESLAKIFVKQGKNEKAIDIYKKLIWKFPQKKALFAAQIEKLKKK